VTLARGAPGLPGLKGEPGERGYRGDKGTKGDAGLSGRLPRDSSYRDGKSSGKSPQDKRRGNNRRVRSLLRSQDVDSPCPFRSRFLSLSVLPYIKKGSWKIALRSAVREIVAVKQGTRVPKENFASRCLISFVSVCVNISRFIISLFIYLVSFAFGNCVRPPQRELTRDMRNMCEVP